MGVPAPLTVAPLPDAEKSMVDNLELGTFLAVLIAFVVCGCLVTRVPKKAPNTVPVKH
jgi:hypothetical protein